MSNPCRLRYAILLLLAYCGLACPARSAIERNGAPPLPHVVARLPVVPSEAHRRIACRIAQELDRSPTLAGLAAATADNPLFPDVVQLRLHIAGNPGLAAYVELPAADRRRDFYFNDPLDRYWLSEYTMGDKPAKFRSEFLLHLEEEGGGTRAEAIEYLPRVWLGNTFKVLGHHGPGTYHNIRFVGPTDRDRSELLHRVEAAVAAGPCP
jgi:hypothetical protein